MTVDIWVGCTMHPFEDYWEPPTIAFTARADADHWLAEGAEKNRATPRREIFRVALHLAEPTPQPTPETEE